MDTTSLHGAVNFAIRNLLKVDMLSPVAEEGGAGAKGGNARQRG